MKQILKDRILEVLAEQKIIAPKELEKLLKLKTSTLRRHLIALEAEKLIKRNFGEIIYLEHNHKISEETNAEKNIHKQSALKKALAYRGAQLAKNFQCLFIDASSVHYYLFDYLDKDIEIFTNSLFLAQHGLKKGFQKISIIGGEIKRATSVVIPNNFENISALNFALAFIGTNAISWEHQFSTPDWKEGLAKKAYCWQSQNIVFLVLKEKFGQQAFYNFASASELSKTKVVNVITNLASYDSKGDFRFITINHEDQY